MNSAPAQTRHSLLASATVAPRSTAASVGFSPAAPVIAAITQSAGRCAASIKAPSPAAASMPLPDKRVLQFADRPPGRRPPQTGRRVRAQFVRARRIALRGHRLDAIAFGSRLMQIDRAGADRAGRAEDGDAAHAPPAALSIGAPGLRSCIHHTSRPRAGAIQAAARQCRSAADAAPPPEAVEPIHHAAMARNEVAGILGAELPLDRRI